tara:strand:+ start:1414 stop:2553 length:1140 start_codon:yes stop_codon:yes gene_type:complete
MDKSFKKNAKLILQNGLVFKGFSFGAEGQAIGEVVFNTGMTGYQEVMTDPSYFGQLLTFTYPEIGNTGINYDDSESLDNVVRAIIVRNYSNNTSNWRSKVSLTEWMLKNKIIGLCGIDTRALVKILRNNGSMNGIITTEALTFDECMHLLDKSPKMSGLNLAEKVSTKKRYIWSDTSQPNFDIRRQKSISKELKVVAIDFGIKKSILQRLISHGCEVVVLPANSSIGEVLGENPNGVFFSNGPGDPSTVKKGIKLAKALMDIGTLPMFGICLGHQIFGLALGGQTYKLQFGHRGLNHPCGNENIIEITSQNHGFVIDGKSLSQDKVEITHFNLNDKTVAGLKVIDKPIFSVQYHPEASPGPHDSDYLFSNFVSLMLERC